MKLGKITAVYVVILIAIIGAGVIQVFSPGGEVKANVAWDPKSHTLDSSAPNPWNAEIWLTGGHKRDEIDTATIMLEGSISPSGTPTAATHGPRLIVPFDGNDVLSAALAKLPHLAPGKYKIALEITGVLLDTTPFRGTGSLFLTIPEPPPP